MTLLMHQMCKSSGFEGYLPLVEILQEDAYTCQECGTDNRFSDETVWAALMWAVAYLNNQLAVHTGEASWVDRE